MYTIIRRLLLLSKSISFVFCFLATTCSISFFFDVFHYANTQSLLPSVMDPKIFKLKCKPGNELLLVRSVMLKAIDMRNKGE